MFEMQCRREYGGSGEFDVFGATRYFATGLADYAALTDADRLIQAKVMHGKRTEENFRGTPHGQEQLGALHHDDQHYHAQLGVAKPSAGRSKFTAFFGFTVSTSPKASFRKELPAAGDVLKASSSASSSSSSSSSPGSMQLQGYDRGDDLDLDLAWPRGIRGC